MRSLFLLPVVAISAYGLAQKPSDWKKSPLLPAALGKKVDDGLFKVKDAYASVFLRIKTPKGDGEATLENRIRNRKTFRLDTMVIDLEQRYSRDPFTSKTYFARDGKAFTSENFFTPDGKINSRYVKLTPTHALSFLDPKLSLVQNWEVHFSRLAFISYITGKGSYQPFFSDLTIAKNGYDVRVEQRLMDMNGRKFPQYRILATRKAALAKKYGRSTIEVVVDGTIWVPLQIRVTKEPLKGTRQLYDWVARWNGPEKFADKYFKLPAA